MSDTLSRLQAALGERYTILRELGQGGMATVYLADDPRHGRQVAIKVLHPELAAALGTERFAREIAIAARLSHSHILPLLDSGEEPGLFYYVMPFVAGESLRDRLERETQLPVEDALRIAEQVAAALAYAHSHDVIHRDIKPENILLSGAGDVMVADFGIARAITAAGGTRLTETGMAVGTPAYMSPEQASAEPKLDGRSDVYSLGCVVYEMLAGEPPYTGPTAQAITARRLTDPVPPLRTVRDSVPEPVERAIVKALSRVPADRYATAAQFATALRSTEVAPGSPRPAQKRNRRRLVLTAAGVVALVATGATLWARGPMVIARGSRLAILPFFSSTPGDTALTAMGRTLVMTISSTMDQLGDPVIVDRFKVLSATRSSSPATLPDAQALSRRIGADAFAFGSLVRDGRGVRADVGVYRTETGEPLAVSIITHAPADSVTALSDSISWAVLHQLWRRTPPSPRLEDVTTHSMPAMAAFLEGERNDIAGNYAAAADAFHRAAAADTTFWAAMWRYNESMGWVDGDEDTVYTRRYQSHESAFGPRDRAIIEAERTFTMVPFEQHLSSLRDLDARYPDDWSALWFYADHLAHGAPLIGYTSADARDAIRRVVALNPDLVYGWQHLLVASFGQDSATAATAIDTLSRLGFFATESASLGFDERLYNRAIQRLPTTSGQAYRLLLDSLAGAAPRTGVGRAFVGVMLYVGGFPGAAVDLENRLLSRSGNSDEDAAIYLKSAAMAWGVRGSFDSLLALRARAAQRLPESVKASDTYRMAVLGAWLGELDVTTAASLRDGAVRMVDHLPAGPTTARQRALVAWADGALAALRHDGSALSAARASLRATGADDSTFLDRSLSALGRLGPPGTPGTGADSLAAIDLGMSEAGGERDPYAVSVNHLAAATALLAAGDTVRALKETAWPDARLNNATLVFQLCAAHAHLLRARIEEAQGRRALAIFDYQQFLRRYDSPIPSQRHLVDEAQRSLARLSAARN